MPRGQLPLTISKPRGQCSCGRPVASNGFTSLGIQKWKNICNRCHKRRGYLSYREKKKPHFSQCGFKGHPCQLDVHHIDGDRSNNIDNNLQTLCANCHKLVHLGLSGVTY